MSTKSKKAENHGSLSSLIRNAGSRAKANSQGKLTAHVNGGEKPSFNVSSQQGGLRIFNVLDYIEQPWGLDMALYPVQRFIVKLYYFLPLDDKEKSIVITDKFNTKKLYEFTEVEYLKFLHSEGRCNIGEQDHPRRELLLSIGRRGGKCLTGRSVILTNTGFRELIDLGDPDGPEYQPLSVEVAQEGSTRSLSAYFYNGGEQDTIKVRSYCGYEIEGTPNHRIKVIDEDGTIQWKYLGDFKLGDRVAIHRKTDLWATSQVDTSLYLDGLTGYKKVNLPSVLDEKWATLLGVLVGDGTWVRTNAVDITVGPYPEWLNKVEVLLESTVGTPITTRFDKILEDGTPSYTSRVQFHSTSTRTFLDRLGYTIGTESHLKRIPWVIWRSPKNVVAGFLRGLFETDGSAESGGRKVSFSTASEKLASEVQLLLLNFGIVSRVKPRWNKKYNKWYQHLQIVGVDSLRLFSSQIGFLSDRKRALLESHIVKGTLGNKSATEAIPFQKNWCRRLLESVPKNKGGPGKKPGWRRSTLRAALGNTVKNCKEDLSYPRLRVAIRVAHEVGADPGVISHFEELLGAGYFYDEVVSVSPGRARVYDLNVPDGESFVANGMTNHNTTLSAIFASYELYRVLSIGNPQEYYGLPTGNRIQLISVATDKDQAGLLFSEVTSHLAKCDYFRPYMVNNTLSYVQFRTPSDIAKYGPVKRQENGKFSSLNGKASIRITFKSCVAKGLRGSGNIVVIMDEMAHFLNKGQSSAKDIYDAVTPSTAAFSPKDPNNTALPIGDVEARVICISSPLNKAGMFFELYDRAMKGGSGAKNMLAIQAPTWEVNPTLPSSYYLQKYHADAAVFETEHGAQFSDRVRGWIEREEDLLACINNDLRPKEAGIPRYPHQMGIDVGLMDNGTAIFITHVENGKIILDYHEIWYAGRSWRDANPHLESPPHPYARSLESVERLDFEEIANWIEMLSKRFYISEAIFDRWNGLPLEQLLVKKGLNQFRSDFFTSDQNSRMYQEVKLAMYDKQLELYNYMIPGRFRVTEEGEQVDLRSSKHSPFIAELLTLQSEQRSKNMVLVAAPKIAGSYDDMSDAFVRAAWLSSQKIVSTKYVSGYKAAAEGAGQASTNRTSTAYQLKRARSHGMFTERMAPRGGRSVFRR